MPFGEFGSLMGLMPTIGSTGSGVRKMTVYLHPRMVAFDQPVRVRVIVNGAVAFDGKVKKDPVMMLDFVRKFDDRGRLFWGKVELEIATDVEVPLGN